MKNLDKHVKTTNFKQNLSSVLQRTVIYKIDCGYWIEHLWEMYRTTIYVTLLRHLIRFLSYARIFLLQYLAIPASPLLRPSEHSVGSRDESKSFEIIFVEVWDNILTYILDLSWVIITLWQICHPYTNACRQLVAHCASNSNCRIWRNLRTSEHISRLECIICSNILYPFSALFIVECLYNTVFVYNIPIFP